MKIKQRRNGEWCMEHNGVEAPYIVDCHTEGKFTVFDLDDQDNEDATPVAHLEDAETCERLALAHFQSN